MADVVRMPRGELTAARMARRAVLALTGLVTALLLAGYALTAWRSYVDAVEDASAATASLAGVLDEHAQKTLRIIDLTLEGLADSLRHDGGPSMVGQGQIARLVEDRKRAVDEILNILVIDADGRPLAAALSGGPRNVNDRSYFVAHRDDPNVGLFVAEPGVSTSGRGRIVVMSHRIARTDGSFAGVVAASVTAGYFQDFYKTVDVGPSGAVSLRTSTGAIVARQPATDALLRDEVRPDPTISSAASAGRSAGTIDYTSQYDGVRRIVSFRTVAGSPLIVSVGRAYADFLAPWRADLSRYGAAVLVLLGAAVSGCWFLLRQMAAREIADARRRASTRAADESVRRSEAKERNTRQRLETILEQMPIGCVLADNNFRIIVWNPSMERIFGYTAAEAIGNDTMDLIMPEENRSAIEERRRHLLRGEIVSGDHRTQRTKDGRKITCERYNTPLFGADGEFRGVIAMYQDVTERLQAEEALRQAQKMDAVGQLTGGVAHDFNNLLTVIIGSSEILEDPDLPLNEIKHLAQTVRSAGERGAALTQRLLAFARRQPLSPILVDLNELVRGMETIIRRTIGEDIDVELALSGEQVRAFADGSQVESAILNLAVNSRHAMPDGGRLTIETDNVELDEDYARAEVEVTPGRYVMLAVTDTGSGMAPEVIRRAFEPFFTTKEVGKGSGLGLSQVYGFAKQSKGHVKIYSEVGHGTTVKLYLPQASSEAVAPVRGEEMTPRTTGSESILVVEDDDMVRAFVTTQLRSFGYVVVEAPDGVGALSLLEQHDKIDLLFTDVILPKGLKGPELARRVQQLRPSIRVLFTSGYTENAIIHQGRLDPGVHLLPKPFRKADLARKIREVLDEHRS